MAFFIRRLVLVNPFRPSGYTFQPTFPLVSNRLLKHPGGIKLRLKTHACTNRCVSRRRAGLSLAGELVSGAVAAVALVLLDQVALVISGTVDFETEYAASLARKAFGSRIVREDKVSGTGPALAALDAALLLAHPAHLALHQRVVASLDRTGRNARRVVCAPFVALHR